MDDVTTWIRPKALAKEVAVTGHAEGARADKRRATRAGKIVEKIATAPSGSFPTIFAKPADLEGVYRFLNSDRFGWRDLLEPHVRCTTERAPRFETVVVAHDSSDLTVRKYDPATPREFFAPVTSRTQGMLFHAALAIGFGQEPPVPLGLLSLQPYVHQHEDRTQEFRDFWRRHGGLYDHEMVRWFNAVDKAEETLRPTGKQVVHVMDREADSYGLLAYLTEGDLSFVVRLVEQNRRDGETGLKLGAALKEVPFVATRRVRLGARGPLRGTKATARHPARKERDATLHFRAKKVILRRPARRDSCYANTPWDDVPRQLEVNVVQALEVSPPAGEAPVQWLLLTTEAIETPEDIVRVVDLYRARWLIEEFFKALKTGCSLEKRQLESAEAMLKTLALLAPVAWQLLVTRHLADIHPDLPWRTVLPEESFRLLQAEVGKRKLPDDATVTDVMFQIAAIGGHRKNNGRPGWQTLGRGMEKLLTWLQGAALMRKAASLNGP